jgi:hypothetical protein
MIELTLTLDTGITPLIYTPPHIPMKRHDWPTLGSLILINKRIIVFIDKNTTNSAGQPLTNFILPQFPMVTPLSSPSLSLPYKLSPLINRYGKTPIPHKIPHSHANPTEQPVLSNHTTN